MPLISQVAGIKGMFLANRKLDNQVKTYITYNRGRDWRLLQAPSQDLKGNSIHCVLVSVSQHAAFTLLFFYMCVVPSKHSLERTRMSHVVVGTVFVKALCSRSERSAGVTQFSNLSFQKVEGEKYLSDRAASVLFFSNDLDS